MPDNPFNKLADAANPGKRLGDLGDGIGKLADGAKKGIETLEQAADAGADNKNNRWSIIRFWVLFIIALYTIYRVTFNGIAVQSLQQGKTDTATQQIIRLLQKESDTKDMMLEKRDVVIEEQAQTIRRQDTTIAKQNAQLENYNRNYQQNKEK